jgi:hypothetical protein
VCSVASHKMEAFEKINFTNYTIDIAELRGQLHILNLLIPIVKLVLDITT